MARQSTKLYQITLRAASRKVGGSTLRRGQSFTLPFSADVTAYTNFPKVWDVKVVAGAQARRRVQEPAPGSKGGPPVSPKASATFTGLVNRLDADRKAVGRLEGQDLAGYRAMISAQAHTVGAYLAQVLGGDPRIWTKAVQDFPSLELEAMESALAMAKLESDRAPDEDLAPQELEDAAERPHVPRGDDDDDAPEAPAPAVQDPPAEPSAPEAPSAADLEPAPPADDPPAAPQEDQAKAQAVQELQEALVALQAGDETVTMASAVKLAEAAGLDVPPSIRRIKRRIDLAGELAQLLAAESAPFDPSTPSPADLEG